ncbi:hypothetical protein CR513_40806, partial [Mucuna pruriens]
MVKDLPKFLKSNNFFKRKATLREHLRSWNLFMLVYVNQFFPSLTITKDIHNGNIESGLAIKRLKIDYGGKFSSSEFKEYYKKNGIKRQLTIAYTLQQTNKE